MIKNYLYSCFVAVITLVFFLGIFTELLPSLSNCLFEGRAVVLH